MSKMSFENHIMKQFDDELEEIRTRLMEMGVKVEQQLQNAIRFSNVCYKQIWF